MKVFDIFRTCFSIGVSSRTQLEYRSLLNINGVFNPILMARKRPRTASTDHPRTAPRVQTSKPLTSEVLQKFKNNFQGDLKNILAQNACTKVDPLDVCTSRQSLQESVHVYQYKIENDGKPMTHQKSSGRCWIFACLNVIRVPFIKHYNLDEFEFSQSHLFFWDKIERCNYWLNQIVETAERDEELTGRLVTFLLRDPTTDGGQWDMICNLISKHGLMPKKCFPESWSSEASARMNNILKSTLREFAKVLRSLVADGATDAVIQQTILDQMGVIYRIVGICLGIPQDKFNWEYLDKNKASHIHGPVTPVEFYENFVKPVFNIQDKVCLITDPRQTNPYGNSFTIDCLGNVVGGRPIIYNNQPVELLMQLAAESIKDNEPVWFGCEVSKRFAAKQGIQSLSVQNYDVVFGIEPSLGLDKAERLLYGDSAMTHAMIFTGVSLDSNGVPTKFRVENSWGEDHAGEKGFLLMTGDWFKEFVFEVVVDKKYVSEDVLRVFEKEPLILPPWDPMGKLAQSN